MWFAKFFLLLGIEYTYPKIMNLSEIKNQLQQLLQLVEDWREKGVDELDRDLALGKLREIYSQIRFEAAPQPETIAPAEQSAPVEQHDNIADKADEGPIEEVSVGVAISLDDVFEDFVPEELMPESIAHFEEPEVQFEPESQVVEEPVEAPVEDVVTVEPAAVAEVAEEVEPIKEEPTEQPEAEVVVEQAEQPEVAKEKVASAESVAEEPAIGQASLFGDEELFVPRASRRTKMMSLYDDEPASVEKSLASTSKPELTPQPAAAAMTEAESEPSVRGAEIEVVLLDESDSEDFEEQTAEPMDIADIEEPSSVESNAVEVVNLYVEPQIEVAVATPAASAVPESEPVLGEVIKNDVQTIADTIKPNTSAAEVIAKGSVSDIGRAVGINDRFLLIRDLFGGSSEEYERTVAQLNSFDNLEDCMIYIVENFNWNPNSEGTKLMMELIERKYS